MLGIETSCDETAAALVMGGHDVLSSVVSVFFYLRVVVMMYMTPAAVPTRVPDVPRMAGAALVASAIIVLYLGVLPSRVIDWAAQSIGTIF